MSANWRTRWNGPWYWVRPIRFFPTICRKQFSKLVRQLRLATDKYHGTIKEAKKQLVVQALQQANGDYIEAAKTLGMHPNSLLRLIRNLDLKAVKAGMQAAGVIFLLNLSSISCHPERSRGTCFLPGLRGVRSDGWLMERANTRSFDFEDRLAKRVRPLRPR